MQLILDSLKQAQAVMTRCVLPMSDKDYIRPEWAIDELLKILDNRALIAAQQQAEGLSLEALQGQIGERIPAMPMQVSPDDCTNAVASQLISRAHVGLEKYGTTVSRRTDLSRGEWLQHLQEELLDAAVYIEKIKGQVPQ